MRFGPRAMARDPEPNAVQARQEANPVNGSEAVAFDGCPAQGDPAYQEIDMVECDSWIQAGDSTQTRELLGAYCLAPRLEPIPGERGERERQASGARARGRRVRFEGGAGSGECAHRGGARHGRLTLFLDLRKLGSALH
jgi:hypothetical protein